MNWLPHITVATLVQHQGKLLFVEEIQDGSLVLNQPAGHVEQNETLVEAAIRETMEETACEVSVTSCLGLYSYHLTHKNMSYYRICFVAELIKQHENKKLDNEIVRTLWLSYEEALKQQPKFRSPLVASCIEDFNANRRFPLDLIKEF